MINGQLQAMVAGVPGDGFSFWRTPADMLSHTIRFPTAWQPWGDVSATVGRLGQRILDIAAAEVAGDVHYVVSTVAGLFHTVRYADPPSWQPWGDVRAVLGLPWIPQYHHVAAANVGGNLHVVASAMTVNEVSILHTVRVSENPRWVPATFIKAAAPPGYRQPEVEGLAAAGIGGALHIVVVRRFYEKTEISPDGRFRGRIGNDILHTIRFPLGLREGGIWQPWGNVEAEAGPVPGSDLGTLESVAAAAVDGNLHVVATRGKSISHTIRFAASWQRWGDVETVIGERGAFLSVAAANVAGDLHVVATTLRGPDASTGRLATDLLHTIRFSQNPKWQPWGDIETTVGDPGNVWALAVA